MICFLLDEHQLTGRDFKSTPRMDNSLTSFNNRHGSNGIKPTMMAMAGASIAGQSNATLRSQQPFSFKSAIDQLEDEILELKREVTFCRKEVVVLKTEQDTVEDVAKAQTVDIKRYLQKEIAILDDVINKFNIRQKAENSRFQIQISQCRIILNELEDNRLECLRNLRKVESNLGIETDPNEFYQESLQKKISDGLINKVDNMILSSGRDMGFHV